MLFGIIVLTLATTALAAEGVTKTTGPFSTSKNITVCGNGFSPMNVTSANYPVAQQLYGNETRPAWIASYNGDSYNGACIAFFGNTVNVPRDCEEALPTLCQAIKPVNSSQQTKRSIAQL